MLLMNNLSIKKLQMSMNLIDAEELVIAGMPAT